MKIYATLIKVIAEMKNPIKEKDNSFFKSKYATLDGICDDVRKIFAKYNIAIIQQPTLNSTGVFVLRATAFSDDETLDLGDYPIRPTKDDPQGFGSAITYARRYQICSLMGIAAEEDDDGNAASAPKQAQAQPPKKLEAPVSKESAIKKEFDLTAMRGSLMFVLQGVSSEKEKQIEYAEKHWGISSLKAASDEVIIDLYNRVCK